MLKYIFSLWLASLVVVSVAQPSNIPQENTPQENTSQEKVNWTPHHLMLGFNAIRTGRTLLGQGLTTHEIQARMGMSRAIAVLDLGTEKNRRGETFNYVNSGQYFRFGGDWNFVKDQESGNVLSLGLRYARAGFKDDLDYSSDQGFGTEDFEFSNTDLNARWLEVTLNLRGRIISDLYMGFTMRWQTYRKVNGEGILKTFDIPGFGKTRRDNSTAFDYYIMWRLPLNSKQL
ncbi:MAG: DUF6048 family protein [Bacteroidota bacterium]